MEITHGGMPLLLFTLLLYLIIFLIGIIITRLVFSIPASIRYKKRQTKLLGEIALKLGVEKELVEKILNE